MIKKAAARAVIATHCLAILETFWLLVSPGKGPRSGQRLPAARAMRSATSANTLRLPLEGCPNDSLATFQNYLSLRVTVISFQGTRKSRQKGPKIRMIPMRNPEVHTPSFRMPRMETNPSDPD
jgi:hypothetical protein